MTSVFLHLLNMSITAGWLVLAVVLLRLVFRRAPKWIHCLLWVLVAVRLLCPVSIESVLSLIPSAETVPVDTFLYDTPSIHSGVPVVDAVVNPVISNGFAPTPGNSVNPMQVVSILASYVWIAGIAVMLLYAVISTLRLRWRVREAAYVRENIWQCDRITTPFILGVFRPRIYLPTLLGAEETRSVVAHEQAHLSRKDHWWKPLGFLLLTVYWFNPLLWVGYVLLCRDIEAACDQRVVRDMDTEGRKEYSRVLLACSAPRHLITACPLAFGETGVKSRIKSVLNYKKPAFWLVITAIVATVVAAVCLLTNPISGESLPQDMDTFLSQAIIDYNRSEHTGDAYPTEAHTTFGFRRAFGRTTVYAMVLYEEYYVDANGALQVKSGSHIPTVLTVGKKEGSYTLLDYRIPRDGSDYVKDIKTLFPARLWGKVDITLYSKQHCAATLAAAREHFSPWQTALHQAILANNRKEGDNVFATESHRIYGVTEGENTLTVYALVHYQEYRMVDGILTERSGSLVPTAITFTKNVDTYDLLQYWIPGDNWADSIREKFPEHLWDKALDYKNYPAEELKAESLAKAQAYFGVGDTTDRNTFTGRVTQVTGDGKQILMDCYDTDKFTQVWVSLQNVSAAPKVGEEYTVTHTGIVEETYPPRVEAVSIVHVSSTPTTTTSQPTTTTITTFTPKPKTPAQLSAKQEAEIKNAWVSRYTDPEPQHTADAVNITYYGTYNGYIALTITDNYWSYPTVVIDDSIGGALFRDLTGFGVKLWKNSETIDLQKAYDQGLITQYDCRDIAYYYRCANLSIRSDRLAWYPIKMVNEKSTGRSVRFSKGIELNFYIPGELSEIMIVQSREQLELLCENPVTLPAGSLPSKYNDAFFKDNALVVILLSRDGYTPKVQVTDLCVKNQTLGITVLEKVPQFSDDVMLPTAFFSKRITLEVKKEDVAGITAIEYCEEYN